MHAGTHRCTHARTDTHTHECACMYMCGGFVHNALDHRVFGPNAWIIECLAKYRRASAYHF